MREPARAEPRTKAVPPCFRYAYDPVFIPACVQAMHEGTATGHQQRSLLEWIIGEAAATYQIAHVPGDPYSSAFLAGRAFVGSALRKMLVLKPGAFQSAPSGKEQPK